MILMRRKSHRTPPSISRSSCVSSTCFHLLKRVLSTFIAHFLFVSPPLFLHEVQRGNDIDENKILR